MRMTAIHAKTERKRLDRPVRRTAKQGRRASTARSRGSIRPIRVVSATADTARRKKRLIGWPRWAILTSDGRPLGECRYIEPAFSAAREGVPFIINSPSIAVNKRNKLDLLVLRQILKCADYISFRDPKSVEIASSMTSKSVEYVPDTAFDISRMWPLKEKSTASEDRYAVFHVNRRYGGEPEAIAKVADDFGMQTGLRVVFLVIGPCHGDREYANQIAKRVMGRCEVFSDYSLEGFANKIANADLYIGSSMHGFITAASYGIPCGLVLEKKFKSKFLGALDFLNFGSEVVFPTWKAFSDTQWALRAPTSFALQSIFDRLDLHWSSVIDVINAESTNIRGKVNSQALYSVVFTSQILTEIAVSVRKKSFFRKDR